MNTLKDLRVRHAAHAAQRNLHHSVVQELGRRIIRGEFKPGEVLPSELALSAEFDVSRTVLREANRILAEKGMVESRPKIGTRVRPRKEWSLLDPDLLEWSYQAGPDQQFLQNLSEVRRIIEPAAAELAALRMTDAELEILGQLLDHMDAATDDAEGYIIVDLQFHAAILAGSHNELLAQMTRTISVALDISRRITVQLEGGPAAFMPLHHNVYDAIRAHTAADAHGAMLQLITSTQAGMQQILGQSFDTDHNRQV